MNNQHDDIFNYLYRFRFLHRIHIQHLLHHKHFNRIIIWLNELTESGHIKRYYNPKTVTIPATYSLGLKGRKYMKDNPKFKNIKPELLDRVWREPTLSTQFRNHCLFVADIYLSLVSLTNTTKAKLNFYTKVDLHDIQYLILPFPDAYFSIKEVNGRTKRYFLDIFDEQPPKNVLYKRVKQYFEYYENEYWQDHTSKPFPEIIFICPDERSKNYLFKKIRKKLEDQSELNFYLSTKELIKTKGLTRDTLLKVVLKS